MKGEKSVFGENGLAPLHRTPTMTFMSGKTIKKSWVLL
jgi:hypothetical protein